MKKILTIFLIFIVLGLGATAFAAHYIYRFADIPFETENTETIRFQIEAGMGTNRINQELYEQGLIGNPLFANLNARVRNWTQVQAGEYELSPSMSLLQMYTMFENGETAPARYRLTIREGERMLNIADDFYQVAGFETGGELLAAWDDHNFVRPFIDEFWFLTDEILNEELFHPFEGYFRPLTYDFFRETYSLEEITRMLLEFTERELAPLREAIEKSNYTVHELLSFGAIIQWEAAVYDEMPDIAGVFYNRLRDGWRLQSDVGAQYIADERQVRVTGEMVSVDSPFNTYIHFGLPVGPVSSPSIQAIRAVLDPSVHEYFFFIGDLFNCIDGKTHFFTNYPDHRAFQQRYLMPGYEAGHAVCPE